MAKFTRDGGQALDVTLTGADLGRGSQAHVIPVLGRADPVVVFGTQSAREGRLTVRCVSWAAAEHVMSHVHGTQVTLGAPEHPALHGMRFVVERCDVAQLDRTASGWVFSVTMTVHEVA